MISFDSLIAFLPTNPLRVPDWRWKLAGMLVDQELSPRQVDADDLVALAMDLRVASEAARPILSAVRFFNKHRDLLAAWRLYVDATNLTSEIEARTLAEQDREEIAKVTGLSTETLRIYEDLFFDVRDRLDNTSWVHHIVIGEVRVDNPRSLWKFFGYWGGTGILNSLIYKIGLVRRGELSISDLERELISNMRFRSLANASQVEVNEELCSVALGDYVKSRVVSTEVDDTEQRESKIEELLHQFAPVDKYRIAAALKEEGNQENGGDPAFAGAEFPSPTQQA